jgi:hypothetical protein
MTAHCLGAPSLRLEDAGDARPAWITLLLAAFTGSPLTLVQAEADHRRHAIIEQVIADLKNGPLAHLPSRRFNANGAWLVLASMAFNLTRARRARVALSTPGRTRRRSAVS